ncbi:uncharacterized protein [Phaseolus vulgaris]|uniref:uncharacterized protein n=1 Tax=Phaseolus vulgaris TaxID=3885 RepID=UPI0035CA2847
MTTTSLFGKLREHELEINRLNVQENEDKHVRNIASKAGGHKNCQDSSDDNEGETLSLLTMKFSKFLKKNSNKNQSSNISSSEDEEANLCLMAKEETDVSSGSLTENQHMLYLDSGYSKHMTGDKTKFVNPLLKHEAYVTYGDNNKEKILERGTIGDKKSFLIHDVLFMEGLKHNLLSIT